MHDAALRFIRTKLCVPTTELSDEPVVRVRRMRHPRRSMVHLEAWAIFQDKYLYARYLTASHGRNLKDYVNNEGRPTLGMRIQYPEHLGDDFRLLEWYGAELQKKGPGTRRSIRFNDEEWSLYIDVQLPNSERWHKVTTEVAREAKLMKRKNDNRESSQAIAMYKNDTGPTGLLYSRPPQQNNARSSPFPATRQQASQSAEPQSMDTSTTPTYVSPTKISR